LNTTENFLRNTSLYREIIEKLGLKIKKMYVAEYIRKERIVQASLTKEKIEGMYPSPLIRYVGLLCKTKHIRTYKDIK